MTSPIRVSIVEDEHILRNGLAMRISADHRYVCTDVFASAEELLACSHLHEIDVFLVDIGLPEMSGIEAIERLRAMNLPGQVLMLTNFDDDDHVRAAIVAGARGYLLKTTPLARLTNAIEEIHTGGAPINSIVARIIMDYMAQQPRPSAMDSLTDREHEVLSLLADRKQYKEIADILFMSVDTVRTHVRNVYTKLNVHKRSAAVKIYKGTKDH